MRPYSLACSLPNNLCVIDTKGVDACGCIGSAFNEILPRSPHWLHGESMVADFQHIGAESTIDEVQGQARLKKGLTYNCMPARDM
jgi:hypothetical protein